MKKVIYTCISGDYDTLMEPSVVTEGWDYFCFTDNIDLVNNQKGIWKVIYVALPEGAKSQRKIKITQNMIDCDLSIWVDGNIQINCNLNDFVAKYHKGIFTTLLHPHRKCAYEEAEACIKLKKDDPLIINAQMYEYKKKGFPRDRGMIGSGVIIRNKSKMVKDFCENWWSEVEKHSKRDQLSFNYVMHFNRIPYNLIPFSILKNEFILMRHKRK